jgi:hypothetical protein
MLTRKVFAFALLSVPILLSGCGLYVPEKSLFSSDAVEVTPGQPAPLSPEGKLESNIIANIRCEIRNGVYDALQLGTVPWLLDWGATVTLKLTWDEMSGLAPGVSFITPLQNSNSFSLGLGASATAHGTRLETITFTYSNAELIHEQILRLKKGYSTSCSMLEDGTMIQSDLKIDQFIYDKASITVAGEATSKDILSPPYSVFQEDITFVASFGGNITPTWKFTRISANTSGNFLNATRTHTSDVLITLGPLAKTPSGKSQRQLASPAREQHNAAFGGGSTASSIQSQYPVETGVGDSLNNSCGQFAHLDVDRTLKMDRESVASCYNCPAGN